VTPDKDRYRTLTAAAVLLVAAIAAVVSYLHIVKLARENGQEPLAAYLLPLSIDGVVATSSLVMLRAARAGVSSPRLARAGLVLSITATLAANVASGLGHGWHGDSVHDGNATHWRPLTTDDDGAVQKADDACPDRPDLVRHLHYDPLMRFLGLDLLQWTALAAIAGFALAAAAVVTIIVTVRLSRSDRARDDTKREQDRQWDSDRRAEDRERDDRLRREAAAEWDSRNRAEQRDREDYEARQVIVDVVKARPEMNSAGRDPNHRIIVSTPASYPIRWVDAMITYRANGNLGMTDPGWGAEAPVSENGRTYYRRWADIPAQSGQPAVIVRFVDRHGTLYYAYLHQTRRFPQNTDWNTAATEIDNWVRTGPGPADAEPAS
jgi:hypothetical protein